MTLNLNNLSNIRVVSLISRSIPKKFLSIIDIKLSEPLFDIPQSNISPESVLILVKIFLMNATKFFELLIALLIVLVLTKTSLKGILPNLLSCCVFLIMSVE